MVFSHGPFSTLSLTSDVPLKIIRMSCRSRKTTKQLTRMSFFEKFITLYEPQTKNLWTVAESYRKYYEIILLLFEFFENPVLEKKIFKQQI